VKITKACDYSLRLMVYLAAHGDQRLVSIREISEKIDIPKSFLGNIVQKLSAVGLVETTKGAHGGLRLIRHPDDITSLEVMEAVDGPIALSGCQKSHGCGHKHYCDVKPLMDRVQRQLVDTLRGTTITDMVEMGPGGFWGDMTKTRESYTQ
jgi:Rrf2 family protein